MRFLHFLFSLYFLVSTSAKANDLAFAKEITSHKNVLIIKDLIVPKKSSQTILLGNISSKPYLVLVFLETLVEMSDTNKVEFTILEPGSEGIGSYRHVFVSNQKNYAANLFLSDGNNPGDDSVSGDWYVKVKNLSNKKLKLKKLQLTINSRED